MEVDELTRGESRWDGRHTTSCVCGRTWNVETITSRGKLQTYEVKIEGQCMWFILSLSLILVSCALSFYRSVRFGLRGVT